MWESLPDTGYCNNVYNEPTELHTHTHISRPRLSLDGTLRSASAGF
eukprot:COSAG03_NODE_11940_length_569_cov_1.485106_1_plen_45_part_10